MTVKLDTSIATLVNGYIDEGLSLGELNEAIKKAWLAEKRDRRVASVGPEAIKAKRQAAAKKAAATLAENKAHYEVLWKKFDEEEKLRNQRRQVMERHLGPALWKAVQEHYDYRAFGGHPAAWAWSINENVDPKVIAAAAKVAGFTAKDGKVTVAQVG